MSWRYTDRPHKHVFSISLLIIMVAAGGYFAYKHYHMSSKRAAIPVTVQTQPAAPMPVSVTSRYLVNGTVVLARAVEQLAHGDYNQPFSQLNTYERSKYDAWSTDFECPITDNVVPYATQVANLVFNCRPEFLPAAAKYFNIFDLANNHTADQGGEAGLIKTRQYLDRAGLQYFGSYYPSDTVNTCEVINLPVRVGKSDKTETKAGLPVAFCGWHYFNAKPKAGELEVMQRYAKIMPVFAYAEMGVEYHAAATQDQIDIAHQVVDLGPEFLMANNPHWVQNTEVYKGKLIVYSLGNFIFDQLDSETNRQASIDVTINAPYDNNLSKWLALAPSCTKSHDDCLDQAEKQGLSKVKLGLKYDFVAGINGYKIVTHKADATIQAAVGQRLNWTETLQALQASHPAN